MTAAEEVESTLPMLDTCGGASDEIIPKVKKQRDNLIKSTCC